MTAHVPNGNHSYRTTLVFLTIMLTSPYSHPIYRHPADSSPPTHPFSPTVTLIRDHVSKALNQPLNHVLIQHYRTGADYISEHSDKTIDVVKGSKIVNVSIGAQRVMTLKTKKDALLSASKSIDDEGAHGEGTKRLTQRVPLPHNSCFVMGLETNARWMHSIRADKRLIVTKSPAEWYNNGERISLTFRHIGTFLAPSSEAGSKGKIWGQGAKAKTREEAHEVICGGPEAAALIEAFGAENHQSDFVWDDAYSGGSDVLHFKGNDDLAP